MRYARRAAADAQFRELVQDSRCRRCDPAVAHRHAQHRVRLPRQVIEQGRIGAQELGYAVYFFLTFWLSFPAYLLLPQVRRMLEREAGP